MMGTLAIVGVIAAEALAIYVVAAWLSVTYADGQHAVNGVTLVVITLAAFGLPRFLGNLDIDTRARWALAAFSTWFLLYGALRIEFAGDFALWDFGWVARFLESPSETTDHHGDVLVGALFLIGAWVFGLVRSEADIDLELVPKELGGWFAAVTLVAVLASTASAADDVGRAAGAFYAVGIVALALSQSARSGASIGALRTGGITAVLLGGTLAAVIVCILVFGVLWGPLAPPIGHVLSLLLRGTLLAIFTPLAWVLGQVFGLFIGDAATRPDVIAGLENVVSDASDPEDAELAGPARIAIYAVRALFLIVMVAIVAGIVALVMRLRKRSRTVTGVTATASSTGGGLAADARSLLGRLRPHGRTREVDGDDAVRLYVAVLDEAERRGHERSPGLTAEEFAPELSQAFQTPVTDEITSAFEQARYAGRQPDPSTVRELERRWRTSTR